MAAYECSLSGATTGDHAGEECTGEGVWTSDGDDGTRVQLLVQPGAAAHRRSVSSLSEVARSLV